MIRTAALTLTAALLVAAFGCSSVDNDDRAPKAPGCDENTNCVAGPNTGPVGGFPDDQSGGTISGGGSGPEPNGGAAPPGGSGGAGGGGGGSAGSVSDGGTTPVTPGGPDAGTTPVTPGGGSSTTGDGGTSGASVDGVLIPIPI